MRLIGREGGEIAPTTAKPTTPEEEYICPAGFLCGWLVGMEFAPGLCLPR